MNFKPGSGSWFRNINHDTDLNIVEYASYRVREGSVPDACLVGGGLGQLPAHAR